MLEPYTCKREIAMKVIRRARRFGVMTSELIKNGNCSAMLMI